MDDLDDPRDDRTTTPRGHDVGLIEEMLSLSYEERLERNCRQATVLLDLRAAMRRARGEGPDDSDGAPGASPEPSEP